MNLPIWPGSLEPGAFISQMLPNGLLKRRELFIATSLSPLLLLSSPRPSKASLVQFPTNKLQNTYILTRAGLSYAEDKNLIATNPVWKQSGASSLSEAGRRQVLTQTVPILKEACSEGCWIWPSMTMGSYQTAEIIADELSIGDRARRR